MGNKYLIKIAEEMSKAEQAWGRRPGGTAPPPSSNPFDPKMPENKAIARKAYLGRIGSKLKSLGKLGLGSAVLYGGYKAFSKDDDNQGQGQDYYE